MTVTEKIDVRFEKLSEIKKSVLVCSLLLLVTTFITFFPVAMLIISQSFTFTLVTSVLLFVVIQAIFFFNMVVQQDGEITSIKRIDREDCLMSAGFAFPLTSYFTVYLLLSEDEEILSCLYNKNGINWFLFNIWRAMSSKYMKVKTTDITRYEGFQLLNINKFTSHFEMYVRVRNDNEEAMLILLQE